MFCLGNQNQHDASLLVRCRKALWRVRTNHHLKNIKLDRNTSPTLTVLDAPSAYGKTYALHKFSEINKNKKIKILSCESVVDRLIEYIQEQPAALRTTLLRDLSDDSDCIIIEDIDVVLAGKQTTQEEVAVAVMRAMDDNTSIVVTGINIKERVPYFYKTIMLRWVYSTTYIKA